MNHGYHTLNIQYLETLGHIKICSRSLSLRTFEIADVDYEATMCPITAQCVKLAKMKD